MCLICLNRPDLPSPQEAAEIHAAIDPGDWAATAPVWGAGPSAADINAISRQLSHNFWAGYGGSWRAFDVDPGGTIAVDLSALTDEGRALANLALDVWTEITGLTFDRNALPGLAKITFDDNQSGAFASSQVAGNTILQSHVNVSTSWIATYGTQVDGYSFQTYVHEIGHALGLGHAGNYNGTADFGSQAINPQDSWQASVMSYFSQTRNPNTGASFAYALGAMPADIAAIHTLYGAPATLNSGNTLYGVGSTASPLHAAIAGLLAAGTLARPIAFTISDRGGIDTLDVSTDSLAQRINLTPGTVSDIYGLRENLMIERQSLIENVIAGAGNDAILGNTARNSLYGGDGADWIDGGAGSDSLTGGAGADVVLGGTGSDVIAGGTGNDSLAGQEGNDRLDGGDGDDTLVGSGGNDSMAGGLGLDRIEGGEGRDRLYGGGDADSLSGGAEADVLDAGTGDDQIAGDGGDDILYGGDGIDMADGGEGADRLYGGAGADTLTGGAGADSLWGGAGADLFVFTAAADSTAAAPDRIFGFVATSDCLDLSAIDAGPGAGDQAFDLIGAAAFTAAGQLREMGTADGLMLIGETTGDGIADFAILLYRITVLGDCEMML